MTKKRASVLLCLILFAVVESSRCPAAESAAKRIQFNRDVRPILAENCYACHGPDKNARKAKLRLDSRADAVSDHEGTIPIVPGHPEQSELVTRIRSEDPEEIMPPPKTGKKLTPQQVEILQKWILDGAEFEGHWAYTLPTRPVVPEVQNRAWPVNPIDNFILARLEKEHLRPAAEADSRTLIRRLSFDLAGLPPEPELLRSHAGLEGIVYENLVAGFLSSPHYGERMAVQWLDLVRYADTVGYHGDTTYNVWPYRDYVINAFNRNMPYNQFTIEQLAGDLLPGATRDQKVASGYNRLHRMSTEGGIQDKEYLAKYAADRVRTTSAIWMGATLGCAECHDHKFDPFTTRDFYQFQAFFADLKEKGYYPDGFAKDDWGPRLSLPTAQDEKTIESLKGKIAAIRSEMESVDERGLAEERSQWEASVFTADKGGALEWINQNPIRFESSGGSTMALETNLSLVISGKNPEHDDYVVNIPAPLPKITALRLEVLKDENLPGNQIARAGVTFVLAELRVELIEDGKLRPVRISSARADYEHEGFPVLATLDQRDETGWSQGGGPAKDRRAAFFFDSPIAGGTNATLKVTLKHSRQFPRQHIGRFRLALTGYEKPGPDKAQMPEDVLKALRLARWERKPEQEKLIAQYFLRVAPARERFNLQLAEKDAERSVLAGRVPTSPVSEATEPRPIRILPRGNWMDDTGEVVTAGTPRFMRSLTNTNGRSTRLDLAQWFVARDNPLTARAFMNRLWKMFFGTGFSRTLDDLGVQGEWPTHPELLDWLALEFMESGWDIKHMIRLIVSSRTYRQSSATSKEVGERDPLNRLLARQSRLRLEAEMVRDTALSISGLLVDRQGGPSARPYQPEGYYAPLNFPHREYVADVGEGQYRRGLYTHWQRTFLHPSLLAFDAPSREECTANRTTSNTPLQALVLLNDPTYVEAARVLAEKMMRMPAVSFQRRLDWAFQRALLRKATPQEAGMLEQLYQTQLTRFAAQPEEARSLVRVGSAPVAENLNPVELAAWTSVGRAVLNLHETITRN